jgi:phage major head subunit gpT-like protein
MYNSPAAILKGIRGEFAKQLRDADESMIKAFTQFVKSDSDNEEYLFIDAMPGIREWLDEINFKDFKDFYYQIVNKDWQFGIPVKRNTIDDSKKSLGGSIEMNIRTSVDSWNSFPDELIADLLTANGTAFDGTAFFANTRPNLQGANAIDNLYSGTGVTLAQVEADFKGAKDALRAFRDRNDKPMNRRTKLAVFIPPHLEDRFAVLRESRSIDLGSGAITNTLLNTFDIIINYFQSSSDNDWYLINTNAAIPAFIYQTRKSPSWDFVDDKRSLKVEYFSTARMNAGYGNPTAIVKVDN